MVGDSPPRDINLGFTEEDFLPGGYIGPGGIPELTLGEGGEFTKVVEAGCETEGDLAVPGFMTGSGNGDMGIPGCGLIERTHEFLRTPELLNDHGRHLIGRLHVPRAISL